jgi:hypothetical protein
MKEQFIEILLNAWSFHLAGKSSKEQATLLLVVVLKNGRELTSCEADSMEGGAQPQPWSQQPG